MRRSFMAKEIAKSNFERRAATAVSRIPHAKPEPSPVTARQRQIMICEAAYYIAEHRGFEPGHDMDNWLAAERQIDAALAR
jgi:hypothetical protein